MRMRIRWFSVADPLMVFGCLDATRRGLRTLGRRAGRGGRWLRAFGGLRS